jgi:leucyl aminopeptidase
MQFAIKTGEPTKIKTACAVLPLFEGSELSGVTKEFDRTGRGAIRNRVRTGDAGARLGKTRLVSAANGAAAAQWLLVGCGPRESFGHKQLGTAVSAAVAALADTGIREAVSFLALGLPEDTVDDFAAARTTVLAARSAIYRFSEHKSSPVPAPKLSRFGLAARGGAASADARAGIKVGVATANGMDLTRDLGNRPPNVCTPSHLADAAKSIAKDFDRMEVKVMDEREMKRLGMGALLGVTQGAAEPARLIVLQYKGASSRSAPVALCGKGVTFDTGGISLKPPPKMDEMKFDMCGAGSVLGAMRSVGELQPECNVVAVIPACENMPGSRATRPGDIVTSLSGQTIEILNTDAEGRLILCDALTYALRFKPRCIIDVATLTGACVVALGHLYTGLFSRDDALAADLREAGRRTLDEVWPMPVDEEYGESLQSNFADFANAGSRDGGASIAAQFLSRFVKDTPWAHLDIAGVAWRAPANKGATGRPVPLLVDFLLGA